MVKTKLVIWDWNGTLLDDTALCYAVANRMREERGMQPLPDVDAYKAVFRFPIIEYYKDMGYTFEQESYEAISEEFVRLYMEGAPSCQLQERAAETLGRITARGIRQVMLSATGQARLEEQVAWFPIGGYFDGIFGQQDDLAYGKTARAAACIRDCGLAPAEVVFVGDTDHDYEVAEAVGCRCVLVTNGHQPADRLRACGVPLIGTLSELPALL